MINMKMYSVVLRKSINVPDNKIKYVTKNGRTMAKGTYMVGKVEHVATQFCKSRK